MSPSEDPMLAPLAPFIEGRQQSTIEVLIWVFRTGRQIEAWLADALASEGLDASQYAMLSALWLSGEPHRLTAGEISEQIVQTTGGTTKTIRRLEDRGLVMRVSDPGDGRRTLVALTEPGLECAQSTLDHVLDAFELDIGGLDTAERSQIGECLAKLSHELTERLQRR